MLPLLANELQSKLSLTLALRLVSSAHTVSHTVKSHFSCVSTVSPCSPTIACYPPFPNANTSFFVGPCGEPYRCNHLDGKPPLLPLSFLHGCTTPVLAPCMDSLEAGARSCNNVWGNTITEHELWTNIFIVLFLYIDSCLMHYYSE